MHTKQLIIFKLLGIFLFVFAINEIACRFLLPPEEKIVTAYKPGNTSGADTPVKKSNAPRQLRPNRIVTIDNHHLSKKNVVIETNSIGYRNREIAARSDEPGYKRILFLGDSIVFQDSFNEEETFVRLIERQARQRQKPWETINAAVGAISLKTELAILRKTGLAFEPDVVVVNFYLNDFQESRRGEIPKPPNKWLSQSRFLTQLTASLTPKQQPAKKITPQDKQDAVAQWQKNFEQNHTFANGFFNENPEAFNTLIRSRFNDIGGAWSPEAWIYMQPLFAELKRLSVKNDFQLVIVFHPTYYQIYTEFINDYPQQQLKRIATDLDIPVLDLLPPLRAEALRTGDPSIYHGKKMHREIFFDECHHTEAATLFVADQIYAFLSEKI